VEEFRGKKRGYDTNSRFVEITVTFELKRGAVPALSLQNQDIQRLSSVSCQACPSTHRVKRQGRP
jgi:hypothetical protein